MDTILVPTDFSATAINAIMYAAGIAKQLGSKKIILYNAYQQPIATDANMAVVDLVSMEELSKASVEGLANAKLQLAAICGKEIEVITISECTLLSTGINEICRANKVSLVVMGITGRGRAAETLIGSYTVHVSKHSIVPVIIVPPETKYTTIEKVMLACDFKQVVETTPMEPIKKILDATKAKLFVLNVDHNQKKFTPDTPFESLMLDTLLQGYNPEYHFMDNVHFTDAINDFSSNHQIDLIIIIPKKHGLFDGLFQRSHTKALAFHTHIPLMVVHE